MVHIVCHICEISVHKWMSNTFARKQADSRTHISYNIIIHKSIPAKLELMETSTRWKICLIALPKAADSMWINFISHASTSLCITNCTCSRGEGEEGEGLGMRLACTASCTHLLSAEQEDWSCLVAERIDHVVDLLGTQLQTDLLPLGSKAKQQTNHHYTSKQNVSHHTATMFTNACSLIYMLLLISVVTRVCLLLYMYIITKWWSTYLHLSRSHSDN